MSRNFRQQISSRILTFVLVVSGGSAGYYLGQQLVIWESIKNLNHYSGIALVQNDVSLGEARKALDSLKLSMPATCADQEISSLRDIVFRSVHLKDAGRIQGDHIECSAISGRSIRSLASLNPDTSQTKDDVTYYALKHTAKAGLNRAALLLGNAYVVIDSGEVPDEGYDPVRLTVSTKNGHEFVSSPGTRPVSNPENSSMAAEGSGRVGEMLFATRCSSLGFNCVTISVPAAYVLQTGTIAISSAASVGALIGLLFGTLLSRISVRRREMSSDLRRAIEHDKLEVAYQPIVNLATQKIVGVEALARWTDVDGQQISPEIFVKIAEEKGFVNLITRTVLRRILHDFATTLQNRPGFRISINVTAADLSDPTFLPLLDGSLKGAGVKPESIVIEITERSAADETVAIESIRTLRKIGHSIHIDDFGTGHSNLDKLLYLFADTIKIDKAFTQVIGTESLAVSILPQILSMAKSLNLGVVVEGVETRTQSDYFSSGAQKIHAQGWLYGRPSSAETIKKLLADDQPLASAEMGPVEAVLAIRKPISGLHLVHSRIA